MMDSTTFCDVCGAANGRQVMLCIGCGQPLAGASEFLTGLLPAGSLLKQRFRLRRQVGIGGFGAVYDAEDLSLGNRQVAIKEMRQSGLTPQEQQETTESFQREAHLLAQLHHPNLPAIYEYFNEAGRWYLVMEFITGETLEARLNQAPGGQLPVPEVLMIGRQLCNVLASLHTNQPPVIFRDLKPSNVMITPQGAVYLIDFGIARVFKPGQAKDTMAFGSIGYAAPEQYGTMQTTAQSDIYSLGATLHHLLSGTYPAQTPFHFAPLAPGIPAGLERLVLQMVEREPSQRPTSMRLIEQHLMQMEGQYGRQKNTSLAAGETSHRPREAPYDTYAAQYSQPLDEPVLYQSYTPSSPEASATLSWVVPPLPLVVHQQVLVTPRRQKTSGFAIAALILGILGTLSALIQLATEAGTALDPSPQGPATDVVFLLLTLLIFALPALIAVILGHVARRQIQRSEGQRGGTGLSGAGLVLGYLSLGLPLVGLVLFALSRG